MDSVVEEADEISCVHEPEQSVATGIAELEFPKE